MDPNENPEKIPLNPIQGETKPGLYSPDVHLEKAAEIEKKSRTNVLLTKFIKVTGKSQLSQQHKMLLHLLLIVMLVIALLTAFWLFWVVAGVRGVL